MDRQQVLRILMLEDNPDDAGLIQNTLRKDNINFISACVDSEQEFREAIHSFAPDVVLSDHGLPGFSSMAALKICLKERALTPFILVTGTMSDELAVDCLHEGADDYVLKSNLARLPSSIRSALKKRKLEKLKRIARHTLRRQNAELIKINQELDNLVYAVSHNLRGPLASVLGLLNVARSENTVAGMQPLHQMMGMSMLRLDETIHDILEYARNARNEIRVGELDWHHLVHSCLKKLEYLDPTHSVKKHVSLATHIRSFSDGDRIAVILNSLLSNALLYRQGEREHEIMVRVIVSQTECKISLQDNGAGIHPEILPRVYDMFYRGSSSSHGAGLGLYIAREIVNKLDGKITIYSVVDVGTLVTVQLPNMVQADPDRNP